MLKRLITRLFTPTVESAISGINKAINKLDAAVSFHDQNAAKKNIKVTDLLAEVKAHDTEALRASTIRSKLFNLVN